MCLHFDSPICRQLNRWRTGRAYQGIPAWGRIWKGMLGSEPVQLQNPSHRCRLLKELLPLELNISLSVAVTIVDSMHQSNGKSCLQEKALGSQRSFMISYCKISHCRRKHFPSLPQSQKTLGASQLEASINPSLPALKEWAVTIAALNNGEQTVHTPSTLCAAQRLCLLTIITSWHSKQVVCATLLRAHSTDFQTQDSV